MLMAKYPRVTIQVPLYDPMTLAYIPRPTEAFMVGAYLAAHRTYVSMRAVDCWTITHVPTGRALLVSVSKRAALRLADSLTHLNWNFRTMTGRVAKSTIRRARPLVYGASA